MTLPAWMTGYPGAPAPDTAPDAPSEEAITRHGPCDGQGCSGCDDTGVVYP